MCKSKIALTSGVALFVCGTPANAEQWWVVIQKNTDGSVYLADSDLNTDDLSQTKTFWTHAFYEMPRYGMTSLKVEYTVHCTNRTIMGSRYFEYDADYNVVFSGNNASSPKPIPSGSVGDRLLTFACSSASFRKEAYIEINKSVDYRKSGVFYAGPQEVVSTPVPRLATKKRATTKDSLHSIASVYRYEECVRKTARNFAKLKEAAPVVANAAVARCQISRMQVVATYAISQPHSSEERDQFILRIDSRMQSLAEREIVNLRSK